MIFPNGSMKADLDEGNTDVIGKYGAHHFISMKPKSINEWLAEETYFVFIF